MCLMLKLNGCGTGFEVREPPGPCKAELLWYLFFLPPAELFNIMNYFLLKIGREIVYHLVYVF